MSFQHGQAAQPNENWDLGCSRQGLQALETRHCVFLGRFWCLLYGYLLFWLCPQSLSMVLIKAKHHFTHFVCPNTSEKHGDCKTSSYKGAEEEGEGGEWEKTRPHGAWAEGGGGGVASHLHSRGSESPLLWLLLTAQPVLALHGTHICKATLTNAQMHMLQMCLNNLILCKRKFFEQLSFNCIYREALTQDFCITASSPRNRMRIWTSSRMSRSALSRSIMLKTTPFAPLPLGSKSVFSWFWCF